VAILLLVCAVLLAPPLFDRSFALAPLTQQDASLLWIIAVVVGSLAAALSVLALPRASLVVFGLLLLVPAELGTRLVAKVRWPPQQRAALVELGETFRPSAPMHISHPFLHGIGNPQWKSTDPKKIHEKFNGFGFRGREMRYAKQPGTVRIACLGGSTTASGYPVAMEGYLNGLRPTATFESLNFGIGGWTTAHSTANFALNVIDFSPDYVVIHHAWNDLAFLPHGCDLRGDYAHYRQSPVHPGQFGIGERLAMRSLVVRLLKYRWLLRRKELWWGRNVSTEFIPLTSGSGEDECDDVDRLWPFRRNIETIADLADARGMQVVLTTQPHASARPGLDDEVLSFIDQCNQIVRALHEERAGRTILVDLDRELSGAEEHTFVDEAHLDSDGILLKAQLIGDAILAHESRRLEERDAREGEQGEVRE